MAANGAGLPDPIASMEAKAAAKEIKTLVTEYVYLKEDGSLRKVTKFVGEISGKEYFPQHIGTETPGLTASLQGRKSRYRLPEFLAAFTTRFLSARARKMPDALTEQVALLLRPPLKVPGNWTPDLNQYFAGKTVFVMADNDKAGARIHCAPSGRKPDRHCQ